jgi:hypothetical protein
MPWTSGEALAGAEEASAAPAANAKPAEEASGGPAAVGSAEPAEVKDRDDEALGRVEPTLELLLPPDWASPAVDKFSFSFSRAVFDAWVVQPSPCCAAASVAGACNAALGFSGAAGAGALSHAHIAGILHGLLSDQMAKRQDTVERLLGGALLAPAIDALRAHLASEGRTLGGRKEAGCKPKEAMAKLRTLCAIHAPPRAAAADGDAPKPPVRRQPTLRPGAYGSLCETCSPPPPRAMTRTRATMRQGMTKSKPCSPSPPTAPRTAGSR